MLLLLNSKRTAGFVVYIKCGYAIINKQCWYLIPTARLSLYKDVSLFDISYLQYITILV